MTELFFVTFIFYIHSHELDTNLIYNSVIMIEHCDTREIIYEK